MGENNLRFFIFNKLRGLKLDNNNYNLNNYNEEKEVFSNNEFKLDIDIENFKNIVNKLISENNYETIIKYCYEFLDKTKSFNYEVLNLLIVSLINLKELRLAKIFLEKFIELKKNDKASLNNLIKIKNSLQQQEYVLKLKNNKHSKYNYLLSLLDNDKATVSLCMIVKNEEKNIKKCLDSVKDVVSEIIIVDTGSTDNTLEIAKNYNPKIIHFEWTGDFSEARNKSIEYASGDYILFLDADEYIDRDNLSFFKNLKKPVLPHSYYVKIINFTEIEGNSNYFVEHYFTRIWTNNLNFKFVGKIHENLIYDDPSIKPSCFFSDVTIFHSGYLKDEISRKNKMERNLQLLKSAIQEDPENGFHEYNLAIQYKNMGILDKAVEHFNYMQDKQKNKIFPAYYIFGISALSSTYIQMGRYTEAINTAKKALQINENFKEALFNLGLSQFYLKDYHEAINSFRKILDNKIEEPFVGGTIDLAIRSWKTLNMLGICYIELEDYAEAIRNLRRAFKINKYSGEILLNLITAYYKTDKSNEIIDIFEKNKKIKYPLQIIEQIANKLYHFGLKECAHDFLKSQKGNYKNEKIYNDINNLELKFIKNADLIEANAFFEQNKFDSAEICYENYFSKYNIEDLGLEYIESLSKWGYVNLKLNNFVKAEKILEKVLDRNKINWNILHNLATAKMSLEKLDEALFLFKKAKEINPNSIETYLNIGKIYIYKKEYLNAFEMLNYAFFLDKEHKNKEVVYYLANVLFLMGNYNEALEKAHLYINYFGENAECLYLIGLIYYKKEDYLNSTLYFSKAISCENAKIDYYIFLGNSLKKLEMFEYAKISYLVALSMDENNIQAQAGFASLFLENSIKDLN